MAIGRARAVGNFRAARRAGCRCSWPTATVVRNLVGRSLAWTILIGLGNPLYSGEGRPLASVPLGSLGGISVAYAVINISRAFPLESGGPFRLFVVPPSVFLVAIGAVALAVILGWLSGGTKVAVSTRRIE